MFAPAIDWWGYLITAGGYWVLASMLATLGRRNRQSWLLAGAFALHGAWALAFALAGGGDLTASLQTAHYAAWSAVLASIFVDHRRGLPRLILFGSLVVVLARLGLVATPGLPLLFAARLSLSIDLAAILLALIAVIAVFQTAGESERWSLKFICFPLGALLAYDLFLYTQAMAIAPPTEAFLRVRGPLNALTMPLLGFAAWRQRAWRKQFTVSRQAALYSITLIALGLYLLLAAAMAMAIDRLAPGDSTSLQVVLMFVAILLIVFLLSSGWARARIKFFVSRHFFARKYDYAHEWRKLMRTLAREEEENASPLETRVIRACADLLEVPGGVLWTVEQGRRSQLQAVWNYKTPKPGFIEVDESIFKDGEGEFRPLAGGRLTAIPLAAEGNAWVAIPLPHGNRLTGFLLLSHPRARHELESEDEELIMLVARQCASFLAEKRATSELEENRLFARFSRQYAFVAHDLKNVISQLSLMLKNVDRHGDNPAFRRDMTETVANAVDRLSRLVDRLRRLAAGDTASESHAPVCAYDAAESEVERRQADGGKAAIALTASEAARAAEIQAADDRLGATLGHLLDNALEAAGNQGHVHVHLDTTGRDLVIDIADDGDGMALDFIRDRLFTPFQSTKTGGFGVGVYQCREFAREAGGDLEVVSSPGSGTTMRLRLPLAAVRGEQREAKQQ